MSIAADLIRGHIDAIIFARLLRPDSYGYEINKTISILSSCRFELKEATLYNAFKRLEDAGFVGLCNPLLLVGTATYLILLTRKPGDEEPVEKAPQDP